MLCLEKISLTHSHGRVHSTAWCLGQPEMTSQVSMSHRLKCRTMLRLKKGMIRLQHASDVGIKHWSFGLISSRTALRQGSHSYLAATSWSILS